MPEEWTVSRASGACAECARPFAPGDEMLSALYLAQAELVRLDFCAGCWPKVREEGERRMPAPPGTPADASTQGGGAAKADGGDQAAHPDEADPSPPDEPHAATASRISFWRTVVPDPEDVEARKKRRLEAMLNADVLLDIFKEMEDHPDAQRRRFRFVLSLMLMRRKKLRMTSISKRKMTDGPQDVLVLTTTGRKKKVEFAVVDVRMSEEEMISAQDEVGKVLAMGGVEEAAPQNEGPHHGDTENTE